jgi:NADH-quinone oxidoreductase subunit N
VPGLLTGSAVGLGLLATIVLGIIPQPLLNLANQAATQLFVR